MFLENHVDEELRRIFDKYYKTYCKYEDTIKKTRDIISDIQYFTEHVQRTQKSKFLTYTILPNQEGLIHNHFVKVVGESISQTIHDENQCMFYISLYEIMDAIFDKYYEESSNAVSEYDEFSPLLVYYMNSKDDEFVRCFIGCSHGITGFYDKLKTHREQKANDNTDF